ncbi:DUF2339 domain-containing protein [Hymenobacter sp. DG01]|uniref:DUF2339 domain-containing protein n=1 Tax=Hymenobacter sp. DG01 TaxID=2584940 RepID=UPI00112282DD|nr:DUF2339 domain-containing protein [Hymenobacter sp. DG01]
MGTSLLMLVTIVVALLYQKNTRRVQELNERLQQREDEHLALQTTVLELHEELQRLSAGLAPTVADVPASGMPATAALVPPTIRERYQAPTLVPVLTPPVTPPAVTIPPPSPVVPVPPAPLAAAASVPSVAPPVAPPTPAAEPAPTPTVVAPVPAEPAVPLVAAAASSPPLEPVIPVSASAGVTTETVRAEAPTPPQASKPSAPAPVATEPAGPTWWNRAEQLLLDNWTGILGAIVLVTGIGFLGVYTALRVSAPARFSMISAFAAVLLALHYYLRPKPFAARLHVWLQSSAAAVFLFACVGAVSVPGLQWAGPPLSYLLLLSGVAANLWLAWDASRESVATLHGVLSLVALAVLPHTLLTLGAAAGVTAFSIGITYRQRWKYQLLLSIISFFAFHYYWHSSLTATGPLTGGLRLGALGLVLLVGVAAAVVQYRKVYASTRFDGLLFSAHLLNWTCLGINLYLYSTGSPWKTVPLGLGALLTFGVARRARQLGIAWLFRTDSLISLALALFTAFSLQGWHASGSLILLFMLLETLLVAFIMARENETMVSQVAMVGALLAAVILLVLNISQIVPYSPAELHRNAFLLLLAGLIGAGYYHLLQRQSAPDGPGGLIGRELYQGFGLMVGGLYLGTALLLLRALFGVPHPPVVPLLGGAFAAAGVLSGIAWWLRGYPGWFRSMHYLCAQVLVAVTILGLHKLGLSWPATAALLYLETLVLAGALAWYGEAALGRLLAGAALLSGGWFLLASTQAFRVVPETELHLRLVRLMLVGVSSSALLALPLRLPRLGLVLASVSAQRLHTSLQLFTVLVYLTGAGLLGQALFERAQPPVAALVGGTVATAAVVFGLAAWLRGSLGWFRPAHLLLGQLLLMLAVLGLHEAGLPWPATSTLLYLEVLLMTVWLAWRAELLVYRIQLYLALGLAAVLPILVYQTGLLADPLRALLLVGAALATLGTQVLLRWRRAPMHDALPTGPTPTYRLHLLSLLMGLHLLTAGGLVYEHTWAGWVAAALGAGLLVVRRVGKVPGLWSGVAGAALGYQVLQWSHVLPAGPVFRPGAVLAYLLPLLALPAAGLFCSWWPARQQHVRWPWLYLGGLQLLLGAWATLAPSTEALPVLAWTGLAAGLALAAQVVRRRFAQAEALRRAGSPDSYLLHLAYLLLTAAFVGHFALLATHSADVLLGLPVRRVTAAALLLMVAGWAWQRPPATAPVYHSWRYLHPLLPEVALLFGSFTAWQEIRAAWHAPLWLLLAFALTLGGRYLPLRLRRVRVYGLLFFGAAVLSSSYVALAYLAPGQLLTLAGLTTMGATLGLFAYAAVALQHFPSLVAATWPRLLAPLAALGRLPTQVLIPLLLYPAFGVLTLLLLQTFDRSILTVLLMLEVVAAFVSSLLLRRQDLRYASLAGTVLCFGRLLLIDLRQHGTITRAVVFILMGVLLLGMNALYARFKSRFTDPTPTGPPEPDALAAPLADSLS